MFIYYLIIICLVIIDQASKWWTVQNIDLHQVIEVIPNVLSLTYIQNTGAAWSILEGKMMFFYIVTIIVVAVLLYELHKHWQDSRLFAVGISFIIGGALGNFIDRLFLKYVVDMIKLEFIDFPIFNLADTWLTVGVILVLVYILFDSDEESSVKWPLFKKTLW